MKTKKGSITAYLSLIMLVLLTLFFRSLSAVQVSHARELTACACQQGLVSLFAQYDRTLMTEYELFFLDGGYGTREYRTDLIVKTVKTYAQNSLLSSQSSFLSAQGLSDGTVSEIYLSAIRLASDQDGSAFSRQVIEAMKENLGSAGMQLLIEKLNKGSSTEKNQKETDLKEAVESYETAKVNAENQKAETEKQEKIDNKENTENQQEENKTKTSENSVTVPEDFKNPIEVISKLMQEGILSLVLPEGETLPTGSVESAELVQNRALTTGFGTISEESNASTVDKLMLCAYGMWKFPSYTSHTAYSGLNLQQEYLAAGKNSDSENLTVIVNKLMLMREAVNYAYLWSDPARIAEMESMAAVISASLAAPVAEPVIVQALSACWAFAESIVDIQALLNKKEVPLIPSGETWRVSLEHLADFTGAGETLTEVSGLDYGEFLGILMMTQSTDVLTKRLMDLVELNMRNRFGKTEFRLDNCVDEAEIGMETEFSCGTYTITRNYGYDEQV